jgi:hypothetical protein
MQIGGGGVKSLETVEGGPLGGPSFTLPQITIGGVCQMTRWSSQLFLVSVHVYFCSKVVFGYGIGIKYSDLQI